MLPFVILTIVIPAMITTNTMASTTDNAEVYRNESGTSKIKLIHLYFVILFREKGMH